MKRFMTVLLLVALVTASSCTAYTCATYTKTEKKQSPAAVRI